MKSYVIQEMDGAAASRIAKWVYDEPYSIYTFEDGEETIAELTGGGYYAALDEKGDPIGYFCFGLPARIPTLEDDVYSDAALDIGLGMKPELCGKGFGEAFLNAGMMFARERFHVDAKKLRLTVAEFNQRAVRLYHKVGFKDFRAVTHRKTNMRFIIMVLS